MKSTCSRWLWRACLDRPASRNCDVSRRPLQGVAVRAGRTFSSSRRHCASDEVESSALEQDWSNRIDYIKKLNPDPYPRFKTDSRSIRCEIFEQKYAHVKRNETIDEVVVLSGRIHSRRTAGSKLIFVDLVQNGHKAQVLCNQRVLTESEAYWPEVIQFFHVCRRGDFYTFTGRPHRTARGQLSLLVTEPPKLVAPCLHDIPFVMAKQETETSRFDRHVELLTRATPAHFLRARYSIIQYVRKFFLDRSFIEVDTPILASAAGGAIARPFQTSATEFPERPLSMRIAPELWLKRLIVSGFDRVFEIGPSFRNEGLDKTHNPEFTTCEFYQAFADLEALILMTELFFTGLSNHVDSLRETLSTLKPVDVPFTAPFRRIDFIPALEAELGEKLPDLTSENAVSDVLDLFHNYSIPVPDKPTLPRLLDKLSSIYLEPLCQHPTFIINHPECLSPLSKSFVHPTTNQIVSARAELFVEGKEIVNCYEEENSPFEQRKKFEKQLTYNDGESAGSVDESYVKALETGLPPTGGWGCGIDRLCMLFTGAERIGDVLSFGNLRNVTTGKGQQ